MVVDWVIRRTVEHAGTCIRWKITITLEDLDFPDYLAFISSTFTHIQTKIDCLNRNRKEMGLKVSTKKAKLMRINAKNNNAVVVDGQEIEDVDGFDYLGARVTKHGGLRTTSKAA